MEDGGSGGASMENWEVDLSLAQRTASLCIRGGFTLRREPKVMGDGPEKGEKGQALQRTLVPGVLAARDWQWQDRRRGRRARPDRKDPGGLQLQFWLFHFPDEQTQEN